MKVLFLDVDGCLNNITYTKKCYKKNGHKSMSMYCTPFDTKCLKNLAKIVKKTGAIIVLTSSWRLLESHIIVLEARLAEYGLRIYQDNKTQHLGNRGAEIKDYIEKSKKASCGHIDKFVIIDDEVNDILPFFGYENIIQTDPKYGLTFGDMIRAINKLK